MTNMRVFTSCSFCSIPKTLQQLRYKQKQKKQRPFNRSETSASHAAPDVDRRSSASSQLLIIFLFKEFVGRASEDNIPFTVSTEKLIFSDSAKNVRQKPFWRINNSNSRCRIQQQVCIKPFFYIHKPKQIAFFLRIKYYTV